MGAKLLSKYLRYIVYRVPVNGAIQLSKNTYYGLSLVSAKDTIQPSPDSGWFLPKIPYSHPQHSWLVSAKDTIQPTPIG